MSVNKDGGGESVEREGIEVGTQKNKQKKRKAGQHTYIDTERVERDALVLKLFGTYSR